MWNGTKVTPVGSCALPVVNLKTNEKYKIRFLVVKEDLLGLNATRKRKLLTVHRENFIDVVENANADFTVKYADVFNERLGTLPGKVHLQVDPDCKPVILSARKVPLSDREKFKKELQLLLSTNRPSGLVTLL